MVTVPCITNKEGRKKQLSSLLRFLALFLGVALCGQCVQAQDEPSRFEVAPLFSAYHSRAGVSISGQNQLGGRFTWNWLPHLSLEGEYASTLRQEPIETEFDGGHFSQGLFGVKSGVRWKNWGLFAKFRPGFISYSNVVTSSNSDTPDNPFTFGRLTDAAFDTGGGAEFFLSRHWLFRYDVSDLIVHQGPVPFLSNGTQVTFSPFTVSNFETEIAVAFRF